MWFSNRERVEEDLKRIREANLPEKEDEEKNDTNPSLHVGAGSSRPPDETDSATNPSSTDDEVKITFKDILAMTIAVLSYIVPVVLIIFAAIAFVFFLIFR